MKRPQTNVEIMAANIMKADLWDKLVSHIHESHIVVRPVDNEGDEIDMITDENELTQLVKGQGLYEGFFNGARKKRG